MPKKSILKHPVKIKCFLKTILVGFPYKTNSVLAKHFNETYQINYQNHISIYQYNTYKS